MDGSMMALAAVGIVAGATLKSRGSRSVSVLEKARQIREAFQHDEAAYRKITPLVYRKIYGKAPIGRGIFPTPTMWATWTERPEEDAEFSRYVEVFYDVWKNGGDAQKVARDTAKRAARERKRWQVSPKTETLRALHRRGKSAFDAWARENDQVHDDEQERLEAFEQWLEDVPMLSVRDDGLIQVHHDLQDRKTRALIGGLPIAMFHGTSTKLLPAIRKQGMRPARTQRQKSDPTFSTASGVYLDLREDIDVYARGAVARHGGRPVILTVRRTLDELEPDPDDAHLGWGTSAMQFITPSVPASDIVAWK